MAGATGTLVRAEEKPKPSIYLVDQTKFDVHALSRTLTLTESISGSHPDDLFVIYVPAPNDNFPPIMRIPHVTLKELKDAIGTWGDRLPDDHSGFCGYTGSKNTGFWSRHGFGGE